MKLQKKMVIRYLFIFSIGLLVGCTSQEYQKIIINNSNKTISIVDSNFVIDSVYITKFGKPYLSISLTNKALGSNNIYFNAASLGYREYINKLDSLNCNNTNLGLSIVIRKKGSTLKVTQNLADNIEINSDIQTLRGYNYLHCSNRIDTLETDGHYR